MEAESPTQPPAVVVGVDGSLGSLVALRWAAQEAAGLGSPLCAVHAYHRPSAEEGCEWPLCRSGHGAHHGADRAVARVNTAVRQALEAEPARLPVRTVVQAGEPGPVLVEKSRHARLLVVGSRGHGRVIGALLGSVSSYCQRHAACPVVVIPTPPEAQAERMYPLPHVHLGA